MNEQRFNKIKKVSGIVKLTQTLIKNLVVPAAKFKEHLKLLWSRNEVKFDGDRYYV